MNIKKYVETYKEQISELIAEFVAITLFFIPDIMFKVCINNYNHLTYEPLAMVFTMVLGIIVYAFLFAIFKTTFRATLISYIIIFLTFIINILKIIYTGEPIFFSDVSFLGKSIDLLQLVTGNISGNFILYLLKFVIPILIVFIPILILNYKFNLKIENKKERAIFIIIGVLIFLLLSFPTNYTKNLYSKLILKTDKIEDFDSFTTNLGFYVRNGFINGMYGTFLNNKFFMPDNYDEENLNRLLNETKQIKNTNSLGKPNIIIVFSESFWDIDQLDEIKFNKQITSNFNNLKNEGKFINLISPTYGGMSENVAFELVTGGSMNYFPKSYIPIMTLYSKAESKKNPSLIQILNNNGYNSEIIFGKDYYNSKKAYTNIGFNNYIDLSKENIKTESKISDEFMTDLLIKKLESKNGLGLYLMETIEAHMPYSVDKYEQYDISLTETKLDENMKI